MMISCSKDVHGNCIFSSYCWLLIISSVSSLRGFSENNTILLHQKPGRASVFEELIHATQYRLGLNDGSVVSRIQNEIAAQEMLLKNSKAYKLTLVEIKQTQSALESYIAELQVLTGGK